MDVTEAVTRRKSIRAFRPDPVSDETIAELLGITFTVGWQRPAMADLCRQRRIDDPIP